MADDVRDVFLGTLEASLDAQLRAVRRLRRGEPRRIGVDFPASALWRHEDVTVLAG
jgi:hypothetical protein